MPVLWKNAVRLARNQRRNSRKDFSFAWRFGKKNSIPFFVFKRSSMVNELNNGADCNHGLHCEWTGRNG